MTVEIKAPTFPESVADGVVAAWHKQPGETVARDELLVEIETDKVVMEVVAPESGVLSAVLIEAGETIVSEALLATLTLERFRHLLPLMRLQRLRLYSPMRMQAALTRFPWGLLSGRYSTSMDSRPTRSALRVRAGDC